MNLASRQCPPKPALPEPAAFRAHLAGIDPQKQLHGLTDYKFSCAAKIDATLPL